MSTVQECMVARQMGVKVVGISVISNLAAGIAGKPLSHEEVKETALAAQGRFLSLIRGIVPILVSQKS